MKNFLAIDTSAEYMTVLAEVNGESFCVFEKDCAMKHSSRLMPAIERLLDEAGAKLSDFDCFSAVVGAGSFTGIRIGIATAKGFALAMEKPTLPVTSFDLAAYTVKDEEKILALSDALHGSYYACGFEKGERTIPPSYLTEEEAKEILSRGYVPCSQADLPLENLRRFDPVEGLRLAVKGFAEKGKFGELDALYIRKSQAELNLERGKNK